MCIGIECRAYRAECTYNTTMVNCVAIILYNTIIQFYNTGTKYYMYYMSLWLCRQTGCHQATVALLLTPFRCSVFVMYVCPVMLQHTLQDAISTLPRAMRHSHPPRNPPPAPPGSKSSLRLPTPAYLSSLLFISHANFVFSPASSPPSPHPFLPFYFLSFPIYSSLHLHSSPPLLLPPPPPSSFPPPLPSFPLHPAEAQFDR